MAYRSIFDEVNSFFREFDRIFERYSLGRNMVRALPESEKKAEIVKRPEYELLKETDGELVAKVEIPGFEEKDIKVSVVNGRLEIRAEKKSQSEDKGKGYYRFESSSSSFYRGVRLPSEINGEGIKSKYDNGILEVVMPKVAKK
jgi:HSP20 family protein